MTSAAEISGRPFGLSRTDLVDRGMSGRALTAAVKAGTLLHPRKGLYLDPATPRDLVRAAEAGGRATCTRALAEYGVFVVKGGRHLHVHLAVERKKLPRRVRRHWDRLIRTPHPRALLVEPIDALRHAMRCQTPQASVASINAALRAGLIRDDDLDDLFARSPRRFRILRRLCDGVPESGPESLLRFMLARMGCSYEMQVQVADVGRVDFVVEGWLIIECDSEAHHGTWKHRRRDLRRDQAAAAQGYATYRPIAEDIMWHPDDVWSALTGLLGARRSERRTNSPQGR